MQTLAPVTSRTAKQLLKRLYAHYTGNPVGEGLPLSAVANAMLVSPRDYKIVFLGAANSHFVNHVILCKPDYRRVVDANTYILQVWDYPHYTAVLLGGRRLEYVALEEMTIEDFVQKSELFRTFARRVGVDLGDAPEDHVNTEQQI